MRVLITGASGFVGSNLLKFLLQENLTLCTLVRSKTKLNFIEDFDFFNKQLTCISTEELDWKIQVKKFNPNMVIHLAAYLTSGDNEDAIENLIHANIYFGTQLLDALTNTSCKFFVNTGTFAEFSSNNTLEPAYLYAATKSAFRSILKYYSSTYGFSILNVIPYTIYGAKDRQKKIIDRIYESLNLSDPIDMSPGDQVLDFIHINDVVSFFKAVILNKSIFENFNFSEIHLGTGIGTTPKQLASYFEAETNRKANINWGGIPYRNRDTMHAVATQNLATTYINWKPCISIEYGIKLYIKSIEH